MEDSHLAICEITLTRPFTEAILTVLFWYDHKFHSLRNQDEVK